MLRCRLPGIATMLAVVCLSVPQPADAQIGGLIKKKVKEAVKGETSSSTGEKSAAPAGPQFSETVLELTPANLDREIRMHFLVHNLVRRLMLAAARRHCHVRAT